ncbi:MAG: hypothetical protein F082_1888 [bacterium F082]|nr:MAG: hypothetical protein F082_1888 [bacterium F082]KWW27437.1 MAG: hypothetical protein AUK64_2184 [bacterium P201]
MRRIILIALLLLPLFSSCHLLLNDSESDTLDDGIYEDLCTPYIQQKNGFSLLEYPEINNSCMPSTQEWDTIWANIECFADWTVQDNSVKIVNLDTSCVWVVFYAKNSETFECFFNIVGNEEDSICRTTIEQIFRDVSSHITEGNYLIADACDDTGFNAMKNVVFNNGIAHTELKYKWLLYPNETGHVTNVYPMK